MIMFAVVTIGIGLTVIGYLCETAPEWDDEAQAPADVVPASAEHA
jgi:hypothetical protein